MTRSSLCLVLLLASCADLEQPEELTAVQLELGPVATRIGIAGDSTFAVGADGAGYGWGLGGFGNWSGTTLPRRKKPGPLLNMPANAKQLEGFAGSQEFVCGWKKATVWCWGTNQYGQLANGNLEYGPFPAATIPQLWTGDVLEVTAGLWHACALSKSQELYCWGDNESGQLGVGDTVGRQTPTLTMTGVIAVEARGAHTCAVDTGGQVFCWGWNFQGKLGTGSSEPNVLSPQAVPGATGAVDVGAGGYHQCYVKANGRLFCWGLNDSGQLGIGNKIASTTPQQVMTGVASVTAGFGHTCALKKNGKVACWGRNDQIGQTGTGRDVDELAPAPLPGLKNIVQLVSSWDTTCSLDTSGQIKCWGLNGSGQVGNDSDESFVRTPAAALLP